MKNKAMLVSGTAYYPTHYMFKKHQVGDKIELSGEIVEITKIAALKRNETKIWFNGTGKLASS